MLSHKREKFIEELIRERERAIVLQENIHEARKVINELLSKGLSMFFKTIKEQLLFNSTYTDFNYSTRLHLKKLNLFSNDFKEFANIENINIYSMNRFGLFDTISKEYDNIYGIDVSQYSYLFDRKYLKFLSNSFLCFKLDDLLKKLTLEGLETTMVSEANLYKVFDVSAKLPTSLKSKEVTYKLVQHSYGNEIIKVSKQ